jgi:excisionase family DNA binding protein
MGCVLQVSIRTITAMMASGELPYLKLRGRFVRFRLEDVQRHLSEHALVCNGAAEKEVA